MSFVNAERLIKLLEDKAEPLERTAASGGASNWEHYQKIVTQAKAYREAITLIKEEIKRIDDD